MTSRILILWHIVLFITIQYTTCVSELPPPCDSNIYCHGRLLHTVQMAKINKDSKTFVDMKMKHSPSVTLREFDSFMSTYNDTPTKQQVRKFVNDNFETTGLEFEDWIPEDWIENPKFLLNIRDPAFRKWGADLNKIWKQLGRKMKEEVKDNQEQYSIIWVPNPVIVPGGRFREFYYWDSYWIVQGLLLSEMCQTVKGMLDNFLSIVKTYGHIPNGGRIYYLRRSQPPLLIPMIKLYVDKVKDFNFVKNNIIIMESELDYWMTKHTVNIFSNGKNYTLATYGDRSRGPRPESYYEDVEIASLFKEDFEREAFYSELKAAAESGWDFSSRWFIMNGTNEGNLSNINTRSIVPTDLNSIIYWSATILAEFHQNLNNTDKVKKYTEIADKWVEAVMAVLWDDKVGTWLDYDLKNSKRRNYFYPTNISPLWTGCYPKENKVIVRLILKYLRSMNISSYPGGIPTTLEQTGEQWDFPNAWPPLQHMMIVGLHNTEDDTARYLAFEMAEIWLRSNFKAFNESETMFEKYDATVVGGYGKGGEYETQWGFGWTNGVIMDLLNRYGDSAQLYSSTPEQLEIAETIVKESKMSALGQVATGLFALMVSFIAGFIGIAIYKKRSKVTKSRKEFIKTQLPSKVQYTELRRISKSTRR